ncbi:hypothetical protein PtA15_8A599 [Puccinia triticina]|uniref:Zn(2)-C6 fungal-type domain-containing protein n=1 Tax=Puccinia triticina TaxID=208348 RepID=A0ABY7CRY8_9BASI|nr:uncharacterized protein PtA15_8A599 [Puccinia triticina]WAQ87693.1 hypothetical protein PtA15_8A599 [Puccinia triticina]
MFYKTPSTTSTAGKPLAKRRKVAKACLFCKRSHMTCDDARPCGRCIKREIGHLCCDEPPSASERSSLLATIKSQSSTANTQPQPQPQFKKQNDPPQIDPAISGPCQNNALAPAVDHLHHNPINQLSHLTTLFSPRLLLSPSSTDSPTSNPLDQSLAFFRGSGALKLFEEPEPATHDEPDRYIKHTLLEDSKEAPDSKPEGPMIDLSDFLNTYPGLFSETIGSTTTSQQPRSSLNHELLETTGISPAAINYDQILSNDSCSLDFLTHLDPLQPLDAQQNREDRLGQIIRSSGLETFDYSDSEKGTAQWIESKIPEPSKSKMQTLWTEAQTFQQSAEDLVEAEYQFQRNLVTCLPILDTLPIPGCMWRRSGEIYKTNEQFNSLVGIHSFPCFSLLSSFDNHHPKKSAQFIKIQQLWDADSGLNFLEKFNRIALDEGQKAVLTSCVLYRFKEKEEAKAGPTKKPEDQPRPASPSPSTAPPTDEPHPKPSLAEESSAPTTGPDDPAGPSKPRLTLASSSSDPLPVNADNYPYEFAHAGKTLVVSDLVNCTFSFTVRRDSFGLPCLIIGNFLPS